MGGGSPRRLRGTRSLRGGQPRPCYRGRVPVCWPSGVKQQTATDGTRQQLADEALTSAPTCLPAQPAPYWASRDPPHRFQPARAGCPLTALLRPSLLPLLSVQASPLSSQPVCIPFFSPPLRGALVCLPLCLLARSFWTCALPPHASSPTPDSSLSG